MAIGERIRWFRNRSGMTQRELGQAMGISNMSADSRIGQYEIESRTPKKDVVEKLAQIFDVSEKAIDVPDIDSYIGLMHTLFTLEDRYGLTVTTLDGEVCLKMDLNHPNYSMSLHDDLRSWNEIKTKFTSGSIRTEDYDHWRYSFPADRAVETRKSLDELKKKAGEK